MSVGDYEDIISKMVNLWYTDVKNNSIVVELFDLSEQTITQFRNEVIDSPVIKFRKSRGYMRRLIANP